MKRELFSGTFIFLQKHRMLHFLVVNNTVPKSLKSVLHSENMIVINFEIVNFTFLNMNLSKKKGVF